MLLKGDSGDDRLSTLLDFGPLPEFGYEIATSVILDGGRGYDTAQVAGPNADAAEIRNCEDEFVEEPVVL